MQGGIGTPDGGLPEVQDGITGELVQIDVAFTNPIDLDPGKYWFEPTVEMDDGLFYLAQGARPPIYPTSPAVDDQTWYRTKRGDDTLDVNWVAVANILADDLEGKTVHTPAFNAAFKIEGQVVKPSSVPEPSSMLGLLTLGSVGAGAMLKRKSRLKRNNSDIV
ncbi:MAG: PEP-CTERM sorting domain-containing protein [Moorea sp. SIO2B7]|nr:PEP-CTERM sorting domain-containing protein [Moorena sp. SIO2B7]